MKHPRHDCGSKSSCFVLVSGTVCGYLQNTGHCIGQERTHNAALDIIVGPFTGCIVLHLIYWHYSLRYQHISARRALSFRSQLRKPVQSLESSQIPSDA
jgi:hypothetical protein